MLSVFHAIWHTCRVSPCLSSGQSEHQTGDSSLDFAEPETKYCTYMCVILSLMTILQMNAFNESELQPIGIIATNNTWYSVVSLTMLVDVSWQHWCRAQGLVTIPVRFVTYYRLIY